jgi:hypothetical protein
MECLEERLYITVIGYANFWKMHGPSRCVLVLISKTLLLGAQQSYGQSITSQPAFDPGIMPITSPHRVGPYNLESLPYVPAAMSASMKKGRKRMARLT